ncbi:MAG: hypothetical protein IJE79_02610 [Alphaproteobacteria bacterium]|nr:hypothetical protein [Alphaproteobacteria bacterium]
MQKNNKNIITDKTSSLDALIARGVSAQQERVQVLGYIKSLENLIRNSYYDRSEMQEAEESLAKHVARLAELDKIIASAQIVKQKQINDIKSELAEVEERMDFLSKKMDVCDLNMYDSRFSNVEDDYHAYNEDFMRLYNEAKKLQQNLQNIEKIK